MKKKYNLALIPVSKSNDAVTLSNKFSDMADKYLLGVNSLPHVTLYQFQAEEKEINHIWEQVCDAWGEEPIDLVFNKFSCITFDNNIFWVSLLPNNCEALYKMHGFLANTLQLPAKKTFDPHMTLISTRNEKYEQKVSQLSGSYKPIADSFILSLGASDDIGQLTEIIHRLDIRKTMSCRM